jgi:hypothetical protein
MVADILATMGWIDATIPGIVGMYALMGAGAIACDHLFCVACETVHAPQPGGVQQCAC